MVGKHGEKQACAIWKFGEKNLELLQEKIIGSNAEELGLESKGSFSLAGSEGEFTELKESAALMKNLGINVDVLEEQEIKARLGANHFVGGIKYTGDATVNPISLLHHMKNKLLIPQGIEIFENHEVFEIQNHGDKRIVKTNLKNFESDIVVLATNAYLPLINNYFADKIYPTRGQILVTEKVPRFMEGPCYANFVLDYFRQLPTGEMLIGGFRQLQKDTEVGYSDQTTEEIQTALESFLAHHLPPLKGKKITHRWSGIMGFSADGDPFVGALPADPQLFFIGGFTAHGVGLAFHTAKCLSELIFGGEVPSFINARRFG